MKANLVANISNAGVAYEKFNFRLVDSPLIQIFKNRYACHFFEHFRQMVFANVKCLFYRFKAEMFMIMAFNKGDDRLDGLFFLAHFPLRELVL